MGKASVSGYIIMASPSLLDSDEVAGSFGTTAAFEDVTISGDSGTALFFEPGPGFSPEDMEGVATRLGLDWWRATEEEYERRKAQHRTMVHDAVRCEGRALAAHHRKQGQRPKTTIRKPKERRREITGRVRTGRRGR